MVQTFVEHRSSKIIVEIDMAEAAGDFSLLFSREWRQFRSTIVLFK